MAKMIPIVLRELMWLFGALLAALLLAAVLHALLQLREMPYQQLLAELPADAPFHLMLLLFGLCLVGVYVGRLAVAAVDSLISTQC